MALTVVSSPEIGGVRFNNPFTARVANDGGHAHFINDAGTGTPASQWVYIYSRRRAYNGFWYATFVSGGFKIGEYPTADYVDYIGSGNVTFYYSGGTDTMMGWNSVHLPIIFKLKSDKWPINTVDTARTVSSFASSNGYTQLTLSGDIKASGSADALEQVEISGTAALDGVYRILSWSSDVNFVIDLAYSASNSFSGGTVQYYYGNYHAIIKVYAGLPTSHYWEPYKPYELVGTIKQQPDSNGIITVNINEFLKKKIECISNDTLLDTLPNNVNAFCFFYIAFAESYDDANQYGTNDLNTSEYVGPYTTASGTASGTGLVAINAKLPFRNRMSGNMFEYTPINQSYSSFGHNSKWLTGFAEPTLWPGHYFDVSFIHSFKNAGGLGNANLIERINVVGGVVQAATYEPLTDMWPGVYRIPVEQSAALEEEIRLRLYGTSTGYLSETLVINVSTDCTSQDFYVTWLNHLGGYDYWNFIGESSYGVDIIQSQTQEKNIFTDWPNSYGEFADTITQQTIRRSRQRITLNSQYVSATEIDGLVGIVKSPLVQKMNSIYDKRTLIVDGSSFPQESDNQKLLMVTINVSPTDEEPAQSL